MRWLLFASRVAFICNLFFIACLVLRYTNVALSEGSKGFIIIVGYPLSVVVNVVVNVSLAVLALSKRTSNIPVWVTFFNLICFLFQIVYFLFI